jgi:hypothetical protein
MSGREVRDAAVRLLVQGLTKVIRSRVWKTSGSRKMSPKPTVVVDINANQYPSLSGISARIM